MLISVLMCTYNESEDYIKNSVESILKQTYKQIEFIIVVDNINNIRLVNQLKKYQLKDKRLNIIYNEKNYGLTYSLNKGLKYCNGELIARMDADDISKTNRLELQYQYMKEKRLDLVGCSYELFNDCKQQGIILKFPTTYIKCKKKLKHSNCLPHPSWLVKREVYKKCNGYRDIKACEDYDFIIRAVEYGFKVGNVPDVLLRYRYNYTGISRTNYAIQKTISDFIAKNYKVGTKLSMQKYNEFILSDKFNNIVLKYNKLEENKNNFMIAETKRKKIKYFFRILCEPLFIKQKITEKNFK